VGLIIVDLTHVGFGLPPGEESGLHTSSTPRPGRRPGQHDDEAVALSEAAPLRVVTLLRGGARLTLGTALSGWEEVL